MQGKSKKLLKLSGVSILGIGISYIFANPVLFNVCRNTYEWGGETRCMDSFSESIVLISGFFSLSLLLISLILFFLRPEIYTSWWKFARIYLPVALALILLMGFSDDGGSWGVSADFDAEITIWFTAGLFLLISLILIIYKSLKLKKSNQPPTLS